MKDIEILNSITELQNCVNEVNRIIAELHEHSVEIRISYNEAKSKEPANISLWKATEHVDYLAAIKE